VGSPSQDARSLAASAGTNSGAGGSFQPTLLQQQRAKYLAECCSVHCCSVLQCAACQVCCSVLQCALLQCVAVCTVAVCCSVHGCSVLQCARLQCVAVCTVAVCCSVHCCSVLHCALLQCVAVYCSVQCAKYSTLCLSCCICSHALLRARSLFSFLTHSGVLRRHPPKQRCASSIALMAKSCRPGNFCCTNFGAQIFGITLKICTEKVQRQERQLAHMYWSAHICFLFLHVFPWLVHDFFVVGASLQNPLPMRASSPKPMRTSSHNFGACNCFRGTGPSRRGGTGPPRRGSREGRYILIVCLAVECDRV